MATKEEKGRGREGDDLLEEEEVSGVEDLWGRVRQCGERDDGMMVSEKKKTEILTIACLCF